VSFTLAVDAAARSTLASSSASTKPRALHDSLSAILEALAKRSDATGSVRTCTNAVLNQAGLTSLSVRVEHCIDCPCPRRPVNRNTALRDVGKPLIDVIASDSVIAELLVGDESPDIPAAQAGLRALGCRKNRNRNIGLCRWCSLSRQPKLAMFFGAGRPPEAIVPQNRQRLRSQREFGCHQCRADIRSRRRRQQVVPCPVREHQPKRPRSARCRGSGYRGWREFAASNHRSAMRSNVVSRCRVTRRLLRNARLVVARFAAALASSRRFAWSVASQQRLLRRLRLYFAATRLARTVASRLRGLRPDTSLLRGSLGRPQGGLLQGCLKARL